MSMQLRFLGGRYQGRSVDLGDDEFTIGRVQGNTLALDEDGVSRRHCRIYRQNDRWIVEDLGSTNGVRVNGQRITGSVTLKHGDRLGVGSNTFLFADSADIVEPSVALSAAEAAPAAAPPREPHADTRRGAAQGEALPDEHKGEGLPWIRIALLAIVLVALIRVVVMTVQEQGAGTAPEDGTPLDTVQVDDGADTEPSPDADEDETLAFIPDDTDETGFGGADPGLEPFPDAGGEPGTGTGAPATGAIPVLIASMPTGATVTIDDEERGQTPLIIQQMAPGRHRLSLTLEGYDELARHIHVPEMLPEGAYELHPAAQTLFVTSTPSGASVYHGGSQILGTTPLLVKTLPPGEHEFGLMMPGYKPQKVAATISQIRGEKLDVTLETRLGSLDVITSPAGCKVIVDGHVKGQTAPGGEKDLSKPLLIEGLLEGEHVVRIEHPSGQEKTGKMVVKSGEQTPCRIRFWIVDTKVVFMDGTIKWGMLRERTDQGDIALAETPKKLSRYLNPEIREVVKLTIEESKAAMNRLFGKPDDTEEAPPPKTPDPAVIREMLTREAEGFDAFAEPAGGQAQPEEEAPKTPIVTTAERLTESFDGENTADLRQRFRGRTITVTGTPARIVQGIDKGYIMLGSRIRCEMESAYFDRVKERIEAAKNSKQPLAVRGVGVDFVGAGLVLGQCRIEGGVR